MSLGADLACCLHRDGNAGTLEQPLGARRLPLNRKGLRSAPAHLSQLTAKDHAFSWQRQHTGGKIPPEGLCCEAQQPQPPCRVGAPGKRHPKDGPQLTAPHGHQKPPRCSPEELHLTYRPRQKHGEPHNTARSEDPPSHRLSHALPALIPA